MKALALLMSLCWHMNTLPGAVKDSASKVRTLRISGYLKKLDINTFDRRFTESTSDDIVHNRLNFRWTPAKNLSGTLEIRNRIFTGASIKSIPDFTDQLNNRQLFWNLQRVWIHNRAAVFHSSIERLYLDKHNDHWEIRLGRQRINWGIASTWNPNDLFNSYNFLDFDYEERSGSDGLLCTRFLRDQSSLSVAYSMRSGGRRTTAVRYFFNTNRFDFQLIGGLDENRLTSGIGWAGHIGEAGFKGEIQFFAKSRRQPTDLNLSVESDYLFSRGWYMNVALLYNGQGLNKPVTGTIEGQFSQTPTNLMPAQWNGMFTCTKEINLRLQESLSFIHSPGMNTWILVSRMAYSLGENLDLDVVWQSFFMAEQNQIHGDRHILFARIKQSF